MIVTYSRDAVATSGPASNLSSPAEVSSAAGPVSPVGVRTLGHVAGLLFLISLGGAGKPAIDLKVRMKYLNNFQFCCLHNLGADGDTVFPAYSDTLGTKEKCHSKQVSL